MIAVFILFSFFFFFFFVFKALEQILESLIKSNLGKLSAANAKWIEFLEIIENNVEGSRGVTKKNLTNRSAALPQRVTGIVILSET